MGSIDHRDINRSRSASGPYLGISMKLNQLFKGFGLQKRIPRKKIEARQNLLNKLREQETGNGEQVMKNSLSSVKNNPVETLVERIKATNNSREIKKSLLQRLTTVKGR